MQTSGAVLTGPVEGFGGGTTFIWGFLSKHLNDSAQEWAMARVGHLLRVVQGSVGALSLTVQ